LRDSFGPSKHLKKHCAQLYYICFIRVLDGGRWAIVGRGTKKVKNHRFTHYFSFVAG